MQSLLDPSPTFVTFMSFVVSKKQVQVEVEAKVEEVGEIHTPSLSLNLNLNLSDRLKKKTTSFLSSTSALT